MLISSLSSTKRRRDFIRSLEVVRLSLAEAYYVHAEEGFKKNFSRYETCNRNREIQAKGREEEIIIRTISKGNHLPFSA
jgi:hypothetical protein